MLGLGDLKFGMTREEVSALLGQPDEIDEYTFSGAEEDRSESWHYDDIDLSMSFDSEDGWRMITIAVSSPDYLLSGKTVVGINQDELVQILQHLQLTDIKEENEAALSMPGYHLVSVPSKFMNFWLEENQVKEVQWSPKFDEDDEVEWPQ